MLNTHPRTVLALLIASFTVGPTLAQIADDAQSSVTITKHLIAEDRGSEGFLRGDFVQSGSSLRITGEFRSTPLPVGTRVSFCLTTATRAIPLAVANVRFRGGVVRPERFAEFERNTVNRQSVPVVHKNDKLRVRFGSNGAKPMCTAPLLVTATFQ